MNSDGLVRILFSFFPSALNWVRLFFFKAHARLMIRSTTPLLVLALALVAWLAFSNDDERLFENMNFELLDRTVWTLPEDYWNHGLASRNEWAIDNDVPVQFRHGVASGDPTQDTVILWTRISPSNTVEISNTTLIPVWFIIREAGSENLVLQGKTYTNGLVDYTVKLDIQGLSPNSSYSYIFFNGESKSTLGLTRTLPLDDELDSLKLAVYSCANYAGGYYHAYKMPVVKESVDFVVHLGDYIYEYANGEYTNGTHLDRDHKPEHECYSLEDYRTRYSLYRSDMALQESHARFPWILVWDDHEVTDNSWLRGSVHTKGYEFLKRRDAATQAYFEWLPIRHQRDINKIWRSFKFGSLFKLHMLDTRHYSRDITDYYTNQDFISGIKEYDDRTILGYDQETWLERQLVKNDTVWDLISSQCVVRDINFTLPETGGIGFPFEELNQDAWDGYVANRNRLLNFLQANHLKNSVLLSGDFHIAIVSELKLANGTYSVNTGEGSVIVEFTTSAVSSPSTFPRNQSEGQALAMSQELVRENNLIWNEGYLRGYYELCIARDQIQADYFGVDVQSSQLHEQHLAHFVIKKDTGHIARDSIVVHKGALNTALSNGLTQ